MSNIKELEEIKLRLVTNKNVLIQLFTDTLEENRLEAINKAFKANHYQIKRVNRRIVLLKEALNIC